MYWYAKCILADEFACYVYERVVFIYGWIVASIHVS